jgi:hypothetical protein
MFDGQGTLPQGDASPAESEFESALQRLELLLTELSSLVSLRIGEPLYLSEIETEEERRTWCQIGVAVARSAEVERLQQEVRRLQVALARATARAADAEVACAESRRRQHTTSTRRGRC